LKELAAGLVSAAARGFVKTREYVALCDMYSSPSAVWRLALHSRFRLLPMEMKLDWPLPIAEARFDEHRTALATLACADGFEGIVVRTLPHNFPRLYLEGHAAARASVLAGLGEPPRVVTSAVGWNFNEPFKYFAAEAREKGSRLVSVQHGGGYGMFRFSGPELHESRIGDSYLVWGWARSGGRTHRDLPRPAVSSPRSVNGGTGRGDDVLFVATAHPRYLYRFHSMPVGSQWLDYFDWEVRFLGGLSNRLRSAILFRPYGHDYGHAVRERMVERFADLRWDDGRPFQKRLRQSRLVVIDHCGTGYLEALAANVPTLLFWDPERWEMRAEAEPYFHDLRRVGILSDSPEAAAAKMSEVYDDPWSWWGGVALQGVREAFVSRYALAREDWVDCWSKALQEELSLSRAGRAQPPIQAVG
jgi:putative transferase (TIGR04331 family)